MSAAPIRTPRALRLGGWMRALTLLLLFLALCSVAAGMAGGVAELAFSSLARVAAAALLAGWICGRLPGWLAPLLLPLACIAIVFVLVGQGLGASARLLAALPGFLAELASLPYDHALESGELSAALADLWLQLSGLWLRVRHWLGALLQGQGVFDAVAVRLAWSGALCLVALLAGWGVRRYQRPLAALLPAGGLLCALLAYAGSAPLPLLPLLLSILWLSLLFDHGGREQGWERERIDFSRDLRHDIAMTMLPASVALVLLAALLPELSPARLLEAGRSLFGGQNSQPAPLLGQSLGVSTVEPADNASLRVLADQSMPRSHLLSGPPELLERVVLYVQLMTPPPAHTQPGELPQRYYWRSAAYDYYDGHGWGAARYSVQEYAAGQPLDPPPLPSERLISQQVRVVDEGLSGGLYVAGRLRSSSLGFTAALRDGSDLFSALLPGDRYQLESLLPAVSEAQLRSAGTNYPDALLRRYLQLPQQLPQRVKDLAIELTIASPTPYDRALAIERYLRVNYPYTLEIPLPPEERDPVDYFLFELRRGYCDYFASSMVVLARAAGLPARFVSGFATGQLEPNSQTYVVTGKNGHSWVEIYFPGYGWVEFEPTPAGLGSTTADLQEHSFGELSELFEADEPAWWPWALLAVLPGALLLWLLLDSLLLRAATPGRLAARLYARLRAHGGRLGISGCPGETPYEFLAALKLRLDLLRPPGAAWLLQDTRWLVERYVRSLYRADALDADWRARALSSWRWLRWLLLLAWLLARWRGGIARLRRGWLARRQGVG